MRKQNFSLNATAYRAHFGQKRRTGDPYILHPERVAQIIEAYYPNNKIAKMVAILHDSLEECSKKEKNKTIRLIKEVIDDPKEYKIVVNGILALTRKIDIKYQDYLYPILKCENLLIVKLADILDNLRDNPTKDQVLKYQKAVKLIEKHFGGKPVFIHTIHWNLILKNIKTNEEKS